MDLVDALPNYTASHHTRKEYSAIPPLQKPRNSYRNKAFRKITVSNLQS